MKQSIRRIAFLLAVIVLMGSGFVIQAAASSVPPSEAEVEPTVFDYKGVGISKVYVRNYGDYTYAPVTSANANQALPILMRAGNYQTETLYGRNEGGYFVVLKDGSKFAYTLVPGAVRVDGENHMIPQADYNTLKNIADNTIKDRAAYIQWLVYMNPDRIESITYHSDSSGGVQTLDKEQIETAAMFLRNIKVKSGEAYGEEDMNKIFEKRPGNTLIHINFTVGITYDILVEDGILHIESSDMNYGVVYQLETTQTSINKSFNTLK